MALINCPECGKEVSDKAETCPNCGFGINPTTPVVNVQVEENKNKTGKKCPKCGSTNLEIISSVHGQGASFTKLCLCGICGLAGTGKTKTNHYWVCKNCGSKFLMK